MIYAPVSGFLGRRKQRGQSTSAPSALLGEICELAGTGQSSNSDIMQLPFQ